MSIPFFTPGDSAKTGIVAQSALNSVGPEIPLGNANQIGGTVKWSAGCSAGVVVFETAPVPGYTGSWQNRFTSTGFIDNGVEDFTYPGPFSGVGRWRISEAIVGGTVTTDLQMFVS